MNIDNEALDQLAALAEENPEGVFSSSSVLALIQVIRDLLTQNNQLLGVVFQVANFTSTIYQQVSMAQGSDPEPADEVVSDQPES